jgi:hypothetical protein
MLNMAAKYASIAQAVSAAYGGPYFDALVLSKGEPVYDDGGSIVTPGTPSSRPCEAQVDAATQDMRREEGFVDGDVRILVLADTLSGTLTTDDRLQILSCPHAGIWSIQTIARDPFGIYWELRGRSA